MSNTPTTSSLEPYSADWLNFDRIKYLNDCILPVKPLLLESNLLDQFLLAWLNHEIIFEVDPDKTLDLDDESLLLEWCRQHWGYCVESLYLARKAKLDLVSYRIITVETAHLAHELYYRLKGDEASFDQLCILYSVGKEKYYGGKFSDIPLSNFPVVMQSAFTSMKVGDLHKPVKNGKNYAVVQLLKYAPASLDHQSERRLLLLQLNDWQQMMISAVRDRLSLGD